ncbi:MAG TPA: CRISPR-associated protein Cas4, partial [Fimbriimonadales bacterium]|nr:CRISPR-associated protein Cas4 [Fimbriimonadales bacterium]
MAAADRQPVRAVALHALAYCERLFYLREVEGIEPANERVWAGRALHEELDEGDRMVTLTLESESLGVKGKMDAVRRRNGTLFAVEHKRGRAMRGGGKAKLPWPSDRIQALAYAFLLEEHTGEAAREVRIRYHRDNHTVRLPVEAADREDLATAVMRAHELARSTSRPAVTSDER